MDYCLSCREVPVFGRRLWICVAGSESYILASSFSFESMELAQDRVIKGLALLRTRGATLSRTETPSTREVVGRFITRIREGILDEMLRVSLVDRLYLRYITKFERKVFFSVLQIPPGQTRTYGEIAMDLGTSPRAVGQALARNPFSPIIPCHRVFGKRSILGFGGSLNSRDKELMVDLENGNLDRDICFDRYGINGPDGI